jgi:folate-binding protein YgfZ
MSSLAEAYRHLSERGGVVDLSDRARFTLTGADRVRFLNGQVSANVQNLRPGEARPACVTTPKGRLCAEIMITAGPSSLQIDTEATLREPLRLRLERYIIADDVILADAPPEERLLHFIGKPPANLAALEPDAVARARRFGREGWDYRSRISALVQPDSGGHLPVDAALRETLRIEAGIPKWGCELDEQTLPPEAGLDRTHIDYHKGCYVGQEVISRLRSVGHVNRQLTGFVSTSGVALAAGSPIVGGADSTLPLGTITSAAWSFALEKPVALGYLKRSGPVGDLFARAQDGAVAPIAVQALPFIS